MSHRIVWFDIPVTDFKRAQAFYASVLGVEVKEEHPNVGVFAHEQGDVTGCIYLSEEDEPGDRGPLLYFDVKGRLDDAIEKAKAGGGKILKEKHSIGPYGYRAILLDSEGNRIALHSE